MHNITVNIHYINFMHNIQYKVWYLMLKLSLIAYYMYYDQILSRGTLLEPCSNSVESCALMIFSSDKFSAESPAVHQLSLEDALTDVW